MIDISVVVPVYNVRDYIEECLLSVMAQDIADNVNVECLVVDDCTPDDSMKIASQVVASYNGRIEFRLIARKSNGGLSAARNSGIREARGSYLYFLDSDDIITADCLSQLWYSVLEHPSVEIVTGAMRSFPNEEAFLWMSQPLAAMPPYSEDQDWIRSVYLSTFPVVACNKLISRQFIINNNLFFREGIVHEDNHWMALSYPCVRRIGVVNSVTYLYRQRPGSITLKPDAQLRRIQMLEQIYVEMASRTMPWDRYWSDWFYDAISTFMDERSSASLRAEAKKAGRNVAKCLIRNQSVPFLLKLSFLYAVYIPTNRARDFIYQRACDCTFK